MHFIFKMGFFMLCPGWSQTQDPLASASRVAGSAGGRHYAGLGRCILMILECQGGQSTFLSFLSWKGPPTLASQSAGITGGSHHATPLFAILPGRGVLIILILIFFDYVSV